MVQQINKNILPWHFVMLKNMYRGKWSFSITFETEISMIHNPMLITSATFMKAIVTSIKPMDPLFP